MTKRTINRIACFAFVFMGICHLWHVCGLPSPYMGIRYLHAADLVGLIGGLYFASKCGR